MPQTMPLSFTTQKNPSRYSGAARVFSKSAALDKGLFMRTFFFYLSHGFAVAVFAVFYLFMLWVSVDMANQMQAALHPTFWTEITVAGLLLTTLLALLAVLMAAYTLFVRGIPAEKLRQSDKKDFALPQAETFNP